MKKRIWLWLLCLTLSFLGCDSKLPTSPDLGEFPVINYFHAMPSQISIGGNSILSWSVHTVGLATQYTLEVLISGSEVIKVARIGIMEVHPETTTTYILTANIGNNSVSESIVVFVGF